MLILQRNRKTLKFYWRIEYFFPTTISKQFCLFNSVQKPTIAEVQRSGGNLEMRETAVVSPSVALQQSTAAYPNILVEKKLSSFSVAHWSWTTGQNRHCWSYSTFLHMILACESVDWRNYCKLQFLAHSFSLPTSKRSCSWGWFYLGLHESQFCSNVAYMGTFVETAIVNYSLFIVCRPRKTNFRGFAPNKRLDIYSIYINIYVDIDIYIYCILWRKKSYVKQKPRRFSLIRLPFAHLANESSSFVRLLTKKQQKLSICKRNKRNKWTTEPVVFDDFKGNVLSKAWSRSPCFSYPRLALAFKSPGCTTGRLKHELWVIVNGKACAFVKTFKT
jgi:hypothetical protein